MPKDLNSIEKRESKEIKQVIPTDLRAVKETKTMNYFLFLSTNRKVDENDTYQL